jgi:VWFA-related protein
MVAAQQAPVFRAQANYVELTVIPTDKNGGIVEGLTAADFEVREEGKLQPVSLFANVDLSKPGNDPMTAARLSGDVSLPDVAAIARMYLLVVESPIDAGQAQLCRAPELAREFIRDFLQPGDLAAIWSNNREQVVFTQRRDTLIDDIGPMLSARGVGAMSGTWHVLQEPARVMSGVQGRRKSLVFFTCGWVPTLSLPREGADLLALNMRAFQYDVARLTNQTDVHIYSVDSRGLLPSVSAASGLGVAELQGSSPPQQTGDLSSTRSMRTGDTKYDYSRNYLTGSTGGMLRAITGRTGGAMLGDSNDYTDSFTRIVDDNSRYYVLGYESTTRPKPGAYVDLNVKVKRSGVTVRCRTGYRVE